MAYKKEKQLRVFVSNTPEDAPIAASSEIGWLYLNTSDKILYAAILDPITRQAKIETMFTGISVSPGSGSSYVSCDLSAGANTISGALFSSQITGLVTFVSVIDSSGAPVDVGWSSVKNGSVYDLSVYHVDGISNVIIFVQFQNI